MRTGHKRALVGALALAAGLVVGCGGSSDSTTSAGGTPEDAVQAFYDASKAEDAAAVCATLSTESQAIAAAGGDSCEAAFTAAVKSGSTSVPDNLEVGDATINGDTATVSVSAGGKTSSFSLVNEDGWKLDFTAAAAAAGGSTDSSTGVTDSTTG